MLPDKYGRYCGGYRKQFRNRYRISYTYRVTHGDTVSNYPRLSSDFTNFISERSRSLFAAALLSVCLSSGFCLSVTLVHSTQAVEIFSNICMDWVPWPSIDIHITFYGDRLRGNPSAGGGKHKRGSQIQRFWTYRSISRKRCKIGGKLVIITKRKSYMSFRLVPKSATLNHLELLNGPYLWSPYGIGRPYIFSCCGLFFFMVALCNRADHYIFILFLFSSFFFLFPRLISAVGDWMFIILWHMVWP